MTALRTLDVAALGDHTDRLFRAAWALCGSREDAEDLVQETYARVLTRPRLVRGDDDLGYLLRALRNVFYNHLRTQSRRPRTAHVEDLGIFPDANGDPAHAAERAEVFDAIAALDEPFRSTLVAVDVAGLTYDEAATALRTRVGTVMSRLHRARARVAVRLKAA